MENKIVEAIRRYEARAGHRFDTPGAVLFDMDGVLYDSMPGHAIAWKKMCDEAGIEADPNEFFAYEGRTGASTINLLFERQFGHGADEETCRRLYAIKSENFKALGEPPLMPGAKRAVEEVLKAGDATVLVTGSGQQSILTRLAADYPGAFEARITANDVIHGKPDPEPYLKGLEKARMEPWKAVAVDNAPLGVQSASSAGILTIGVRTGPLEEGSLLASGADIELKSMDEGADLLSYLLYYNAAADKTAAF